MALSRDGDVYAWGSNTFGQLGKGDFEDQLAPARYSGPRDVRAIAAGFATAVAVTDTDDVYQWG